MVDCVIAAMDTVDSGSNRTCDKRYHKETWVTKYAYSKFPGYAQ